jgi:hypothetical protein
MRFVVAGLGFSVVGDVVTPQALRPLLVETSDQAAAVQLACRHVPAPDPALVTQPGPAALHVDGDLLRVRHPAFEADVSLATGRGDVLDRTSDGQGLVAVVRTLVRAFSPRQGGVALHAAGIDVDGRGIAFFGISGAGKSTLSATRREDVLTEEQVVVRDRPFRLHSTGLCSHDRPRPSPLSLAALVALEKGPAFRLQRLGVEDALRAVLPMVQAPPDAASWSLALAVVNELTRTVPVWRMAWRLGEPPWPELQRQLH